MKHLDPNALPHANSETHPVGSTLALTAIILVALALRPGIISMGPLLPSIIDAFSLSHAAASMLTSIPDVLMGLLALPTPWLARRVGRDRVILFALALLTISMAVRAFAPDTLVLMLATAGVGAGIAVTGALIAGFIKARFAASAALIMGVYATALSLGSTVSAAVTGPVASNVAGGWRPAAGVWAILGVLALAAWGVVAWIESRSKPAGAAVTPKVDLPLRSVTAWLVALFFACDNFLFYSLVSWTAPMYRELGLSPATAGLVLASFTATFMLASMLFGYLSKSHDRRGWLAVCGALTVAGLGLIWLVPASTPFLLIPIAAIGLGGGFSLGMTLPLDNTSNVEEANVWNAFVLTIGYLLAATGPLLVGHLRDLTGDFRQGMLLCTAVGVVMLALTPFLAPASTRHDIAKRSRP